LQKEQRLFHKEVREIKTLALTKALTRALHFQGTKKNETKQFSPQLLQTG
jgi:hypothetical protein